MRTFRLTSPEMRGEDVRDLQKILNERLEHYKSRNRVVENGIYDRETAHEVAEVAFTEGLQHYDGIPAVTERIEHPHLRNHLSRVRIAEREEAKARAKEAGASTGLEAILVHAKHYLGVHEDPAGSNWGEPNPAHWEKNFGFGSGVSWCGCFAGSMVLLAGGHVDSRVAFCPYIEADARSQTNGFDLWKSNHTEGVEPGWLVLFNWVGGSEPEHVGIVKEIRESGLVTIEGNTSGSNPGDGGMVAEQERPYSFTVGYARPRI
jgi:hypothetical protein